MPTGKVCPNQKYTRKYAHGNELMVDLLVYGSGYWHRRHMAFYGFMLRPKTMEITRNLADKEWQTLYRLRFVIYFYGGKLIDKSLCLFRMFS